MTARWWMQAGCVIALLCHLTSQGGAQGLVSPVAPEATVFRSRADFVTLDVSVWSGSRPVTDLTAGDFTVRDAGTLQVLGSVSREAVPTDVTLFVDTSGSLSDLRDGLSRDVERIFADLRPADRLRVLTLGYEVHDLFGWRTPAERARFALPPVGRISAVYDALWTALLRRPEPGRRHLIVAMTDGDDWSSVTTSETLLAAADRSDAVLHIVRLPSASSDRGRPWQWSAVRPDVRGQERLMEVAVRTGGRVHTAFSSGRPVVQAFRQAFEDFSQGYVLRYPYLGPPLVGWHPIEVQLTRPGDFVVRARRGYLAR